MDDTRSNKAEAFAKPLNTHLQRLSETRARLKPEERGNLPALRIVQTPANPDPPATPREIIGHLATLELIFPATMTTEERSARYRLYVTDLGRLPEWRIASACRKYRTDPRSRFFPTPGQLLDLAR